MKYYEEEEEFYEEKPNQQPSYRAHEQEFGCQFCWDNRAKKENEIYFFDKANNMRVSLYCPYCGRKFGE